MPNVTLFDWGQRQEPNGGVAPIANILSQTNSMAKVFPLVAGNLSTGHRVTVAAGLPTAYYRSLNIGIPTSAAKTVQVDESCAILEARSEMDIDLAMLNGNTPEFRLSEAKMFLEAMSQAHQTGILYGNPATDPKQILGLTPRYSSLSAGNAANIITPGAGGSNNNTSVWLLGLSDTTIFGIYPKGSQAGLLHENLGRQTSFDAGGTGLRMEVFAERFQWKFGVVVRDWRYGVRICNLQVNAAAGGNAINFIEGTMAASATTNIIHLMTQAIARLPSLDSVRPVFFMNRTVFTALMRVAMEKSMPGLLLQNALDQFGKPQMMLSFLGIPMMQVDAILNTEAAVA